jgi:A/G-specific adenine glycosylase
MKSISDKLLTFYDESKRVLPWRDIKNPYYIWISEIMLQQTRVEAVIPYFNRFISELPTIKDLANVDDDLLMKLWEGLGYYSRARNLKIAANQVMEFYNGELPKTKRDLESLKGIGPYTSGAIMSIAYEQRVAAVDGNVLRVFARVFGIKDDIKVKRTKSKIHDLVLDSLPSKRNGDYNQAIMELGATICKPNGKPKCDVCPLQGDCFAYNNHLEDVLPFQTKKTKRTIEYKTIVILKYQDKYGIRKRPNNGLLASLYEFTTLDDDYSIDDIKHQYQATVTKLGESKHVFTHKEWLMTGFLVELDHLIDGYLFVSKEELIDLYSIPTAFKKYKNIIIND